MGTYKYIAVTIATLTNLYGNWAGMPKPVSPAEFERIHAFINTGNAQYSSVGKSDGELLLTAIAGIYRPTNAVDLVNGIKVAWKAYSIDLLDLQTFEKLEVTARSSVHWNNDAIIKDVQDLPVEEWYGLQQRLATRPDEDVLAVLTQRGEYGKVITRITGDKSWESKKYGTNLLYERYENKVLQDIKLVLIERCGYMLQLCLPNLGTQTKQESLAYLERYLGTDTALDKLYEKAELRQDKLAYYLALVMAMEVRDGGYQGPIETRKSHAVYAVCSAGRRGQLGEKDFELICLKHNLTFIEFTNYMLQPYNVWLLNKTGNRSLFPNLVSWTLKQKNPTQTLRGSWRSVTEALTESGDAALWSRLANQIDIKELGVYEWEWAQLARANAMFFEGDYVNAKDILRNLLKDGPSAINRVDVELLLLKCLNLSHDPELASKAWEFFTLHPKLVAPQFMKEAVEVNGEVYATQFFERLVIYNSKVSN